MSCSRTASRLGDLPAGEAECGLRQHAAFQAPVWPPCPGCRPLHSALYTLKPDAVMRLARMAARPAACASMSCMPGLIWDALLLVHSISKKICGKLQYLVNLPYLAVIRRTGCQRAACCSSCNHQRLRLNRPSCKQGGRCAGCLTLSFRSASFPRLLPDNCLSGRLRSPLPRLLLVDRPLVAGAAAGVGALMA